MRQIIELLIRILIFSNFVKKKSHFKWVSKFSAPKILTKTAKMKAVISWQLVFKNWNYTFYKICYKIIYSRDSKYMETLTSFPPSHKTVKSCFFVNFSKLLFPFDFCQFVTIWMFTRNKTLIGINCYEICAYMIVKTWKLSFVCPKMLQFTKLEKGVSANRLALKFSVFNAAVSKGEQIINRRIMLISLKF